MGFGGQVRSAVASDAVEVARIYGVSWNEGFGHLLGMREPSPTDGERWRGEFTSGRARWWVAETDHRVAGFVGICPSRDPIDAGLGELDTIAVEPRDTPSPDRPDLYAAIRRDHKWRGRAGKAVTRARVMVDDDSDMSL